MQGPGGVPVVPLYRTRGQGAPYQRAPSGGPGSLWFQRTVEDTGPMAVNITLKALIFIILMLGAVLGIIGFSGWLGVRDRLNALESVMGNLTVPGKLNASDICTESLQVNNISGGSGTDLTLLVDNGFYFDRPPARGCVRGLVSTNASLEAGPTNPIQLTWNQDIVDEIEGGCFPSAAETKIPEDGRYLITVYTKMTNLDLAITGVILSVLRNGTEICGNEIANPSSTVSTVMDSRISASCVYPLQQADLISISLAMLPDVGAPHSFDLKASSVFTVQTL